MRNVDQSGDGRIRFADFSLVFSEDDDAAAGAADAAAAAAGAPASAAELARIRPKPMDELFVDVQAEQAHTRVACAFAELDHIRVRVKAADAWVHVWNSG